MFKKILTTVSALCLGAVCLTGCGGQTGSSSDKLSIVCTIFPQYDWTKQILGSHADDAELTVLLDSGVDLHNYQPTAQDMVTISNCDLFIYVGGESDEWVDDAIGEANNKDMKTINLMEVLGDAAKEEEIKEGMEAEEEEHEDGDEGPEYDEHVWLSLKNAREFCTEIADTISLIDTENAQDYKTNADNYIKQLDELDSQFEDMTSAASVKTVIFGDRFPFRYLADDYGLDYYAAFAGCSAETEASFETIAFLAQKVDELNVRTIFTIEGSDGKIAQSIIDNTSSRDQEIKTLDSIQAVTAQKISEGASYLDIMRSNYDVLEEVLK
ncbi:MAG: metal ABC transporter substrate-binding protein [Porcipelethomonas sp.]